MIQRDTALGRHSQDEEMWPGSISILKFQEVEYDILKVR